MRSMTTMVMAVAMAGCGGAVPNDEPADARTDAADIPADGAFDAPLDPDARTVCDPRAPFTSIEPVRGLPAGNWYSVRLSSDERTAYIAGGAPGAAHTDLFEATRDKVGDPFGTLTKIPASSDTVSDNFPTVSDDGKTLIFDSDRAGGRKLQISRRSDVAGEFRDVTPLGRVGGDTGVDTDPFLTADGAELWFASNRTGTRGDLDLYVARREGTGFDSPEQYLGLASTGSDGLPTLSADRLTMYFQSTRAGTGAAGGYDIWTVTRSTVDDGFADPDPVTELNTAGTDWPGWLSVDKCRLYYSSQRPDGQTLFVASRTP